MVHLSTEETQIVIKALRQYEEESWQHISKKENRELFELIDKFTEG